MSRLTVQVEGLAQIHSHGSRGHGPPSCSRSPRIQSPPAQHGADRHHLSADKRALAQQTRQCEPSFLALASIGHLATRHPGSPDLGNLLGLQTIRKQPIYIMDNISGVRAQQSVILGQMGVGPESPVNYAHYPSDDQNPRLTLPPCMDGRLTQRTRNSESGTTCMCMQIMLPEHGSGAGSAVPFQGYTMVGRS